MMARMTTTFSQVCSMAVLTLSFLQPTTLRAQEAEKTVVSAAVAKDSAGLSVCEPFLNQLRWHQPFFGMRMWWEVAPESLTYASPACREAIAQGQAPEVAAALHKLEAHTAQEGTPLKR